MEWYTVLVQNSHTLLNSVVLTLYTSNLLYLQYILITVYMHRTPHYSISSQVHTVCWIIFHLPSRVPEGFNENCQLDRLDFKSFACNCDVLLQKYCIYKYKIYLSQNWKAYYHCMYSSYSTVWGKHLIFSTVDIIHSTLNWLLVQGQGFVLDIKMLTFWNSK